MEASNVTVAIIAAVGSICSTVGLEIIRRWLTRSKEKTDIATTIRAELRNEIAGLKAEIDQLEGDVTEWKDKYYQLKEEYLRQRYELEQKVREVHQMPKTLLKGDKDGDNN